MDWKTVTQTLGIENYPAIFDEIAEKVFVEQSTFCDAETIRQYEMEYGFLKEDLDLVLRGAEAVLADECLYRYGRVVCAYTMIGTSFEVRHVPLPALDGSIGRDMLGLLIMLTMIPWTAAFHRDHDFSHAEIRGVFSHLRSSMHAAEKTLGRPAVTMTYYNWTLIYMYGEIFDHDAFEYQFRKFYGGVILLRNKENGEYTFMMVENTFHRSGLILGSGLAEDPEGSFDADFEETEDAFSGHLVVHGRVSSNYSVLPKKLWECVLRPDDEVMAIHIPRGTDLSRDAFMRSFRGSLQVVKARYPEHAPKFLVCFSWMMDQTLGDMMTEGSRLKAFNDAFIKYPLLSGGKECLHWVFPGCSKEEADYPNLPEDTSLQRKLKALLLSGQTLYYTAGVCTEVACM